MEKKLYKDQKNTTYELQRKIRVGKDTLYKYIRGESNIDNMPAKLILDIAYVEHIEANRLYQLIKEHLKGEK